MKLAIRALLIFFAALDLSFGGPLPACSRFFTPTQMRAKDTSVAALTCRRSDGGVLSIPEPNHRICYRTCIRTFPNGTELCEAQEEEDEGAEPLPITLPSDPALSGMYFTTRLASPGFFSKKKYKNNAICRYHVQCDPGQLLHFLISSFSIEAPYGTTCLDTLTIDRSLYGAKKTVCGSLSNIDSDREDFNDGRLYVEFNTNRAINDDGFYIAVTCVRPQFYNIPFPGPEIGDGDMRHRRGTRNVADHTPTPAWDHTPTPAVIYRVRHRRSFRVVTITIPIGASLLYHQGTIRVYRNNQWLYRLSAIEVLQVYNQAEGYLAFYGSAGARNFPGLAEMLIGVGVVHLIQKGVDPAFRLKLNDEDVLQLLYQELYRQGVFLDEDFDIGDPRDPGIQPSEQGVKPAVSDCSPNATSPRQPSADVISTLSVPPPNKIDFKELALVYSTSENGVVRAAACLYLSKVLNRTCLWHEN